MKYRIRSLVFVSLSCFAVTGFAQEFAVDRDDMPDKAPEYSPYVDRYHPQRVFFGDTHHHSSFSVDSGMTAGLPCRFRSCGVLGPVRIAYHG